MATSNRPKQIKRIFILFFGLLFAGGTLLHCSSTSKHSFDYSSTEPKSVRPTSLSREMAALRSRQVSRASYILWFGLDETHADFQGRVVINFELKPKASEASNQVYIDFEDGTIHTLAINGGKIKDPSTDPKRYDGHRIRFDVSELITGTNRIEIAFSHAFSKDGIGLYRFKDPSDGLVYLYSNLEPYGAHRVFPCFDQPDLKASYELTVEAPEEWEVIANTSERDISRVDGRRSWAFPPSPIFSTYVFALHAGPYRSWKSDADGVALRLFARRSLAADVDYAEWFEITRKGLEYYNSTFGYPYPYSKYDQLIVPDFAAIGMENVAASTFAERNVFRTRVTQDERRARANLILHELAHMWFGNLVTMRWWNGLWLNESFATYMAARATEKVTRYGHNWQAFFLNEKEPAYWEDQLVTTHAVDVPVLSTDAAESNFDSITYGKGAAALKQLHFFLGDEQFTEGVQRYFTRFALRSTTLTDFIRMLSEASGENLAKWQALWLQTPGINTIQTKWSCADGKIDHFSLIQNRDEVVKELRPHRTQIALYQRSGAKLKVRNELKIHYQKEETQIPEALGLPCPAFVYPNHEDYDYVKVALDATSFELLKQHGISSFEDSFTRQMIWHSLWERVIDGKLSAPEYAELAIKEAQRERETQVLSFILDTLMSPTSKSSTVLKYLPTDEARNAMREKLEELSHLRMMYSPVGSDIQLVWFQAFLVSSYSPKAVKKVERLLDRKAKVSGLRLDQERRWDLIKVLARNGAEGAGDRIRNELEEDKTDTGKKSSIAAYSMIPDAESKKKWLGKIFRLEKEGPALSIMNLREAMAGFSIFSQEALTRQGVDTFFEQLPKIARDIKVEDQDYVSAIADEMFPALCSADIVARADALIAKNGDLPAFVLKNLRIRKQEEERCIRARQVAAAASPAASIPSQPEPKPSPSSSAQPDSGPSPLPSPDAKPSPAGL